MAVAREDYNVNIVYTPMQGTGGRHMIEILAKSGFQICILFHPNSNLIDFSQVTSPIRNNQVLWTKLVV